MNIFSKGTGGEELSFTATIYVIMIRAGIAFTVLPIRKRVTCLIYYTFPIIRKRNIILRSQSYTSYSMAVSHPYDDMKWRYCTIKNFRPFRAEARDSLFGYAGYCVVFLLKDPWHKRGMNESFGADFSIFCFTATVVLLVEKRTPCFIFFQQWRQTYVDERPVYIQP